MRSLIRVIPRSHLLWNRYACGPVRKTQRWGPGSNFEGHEWAHFRSTNFSLRTKLNNWFPNRLHNHVNSNSTSQRTIFAWRLCDGVSILNFCTRDDYTAMSVNVTWKNATRRKPNTLVWTQIRNVEIKGDVFPHEGWKERFLRSLLAIQNAQKYGTTELGQVLFHRRMDLNNEKVYYSGQRVRCPKGFPQRSFRKLLCKNRTLDL